MLGPETRPGRSYASLVDTSTPVTRRHRVLVPLTVHTGRSARAIRASGGGHAGASAVLFRELAALQRQLQAADVTVDGVLGPEALASVCREAGSALFAAAARAVRTGPGRRGGAVDDLALAHGHGGDVGRRPHRRHAGTRPTGSPNGRESRSRPDFLGPLLFSPLRRTIAVTMEPVSPSRAARQVAHVPHRRPGRRRAAPPRAASWSRPGTPGRRRASSNATSSSPTVTPSTGSRAM